MAEASDRRGASRKLVYLLPLVLFIGADLDGRIAIDWGVYGIPESFVIDRDGTIAHKHIGPFTQKDLDETIIPLIRSLHEQRQLASSEPAAE